MTNSCKRYLFILFVLINLLSNVKAQEYKFEIGGAAGGAFYMGDANKNGFFKRMNPSVGLLFRYNPNFRWAIKTDLMWGKISGDTSDSDNVFPGNNQTSFSRNFLELGGQLEFNFFPYSDKYSYMNTKRFSPYILAGLGMTVAPGGASTFVGLNIPLGVGMKYKIHNRLNIGCEFSFRKLFGDKLEGDETLDNPYHIDSGLFKNKDWYSLLLLTVTWDFGRRSQPCNNRYSNGMY